MTLGQQLQALAPGLTPPAVLEKFAAVQMIDLYIPTTDGRELCLTRYTQPEPELKLLLAKLKLTLPARASQTFGVHSVINQLRDQLEPRESAIGLTEVGRGGVCPVCK